MILHVLGELEAPPKRLAADCAREGLFARMCLHVLSEVRGAAEALGAELAVVRFLPCVRPDVLRQVAARAEALSAQLARVWALSSVRAHVYAEVAVGAEELVAHVAAVGSGAPWTRLRPRRPARALGYRRDWHGRNIMRGHGSHVNRANLRSGVRQGCGEGCCDQRRRGLALPRGRRANHRRRHRQGLRESRRYGIGRRRGHLARDSRRRRDTCLARRRGRKRRLHDRPSCERSQRWRGDPLCRYRRGNGPRDGPAGNISRRIDGRNTCPRRVSGAWNRRHGSNAARRLRARLKLGLDGRASALRVLNSQYWSSCTLDPARDHRGCWASSRGPSVGSLGLHAGSGGSLAVALGSGGNLP